MDKKKLLWAILFLFIAGFSIWSVIAQNQSFSFESFAAYIRGSNPAYLTLGILSAFGFIFFEGLAILIILKGFGYNKSFAAGMLYSSADIYFSAITPSATGGQPASAYFMKKAGINSATITVTLLLNLIMYTTSLMTVGLIAFIINFNTFRGFTPVSKVLILIGFIVQVVLTFFFMMLLKKRALTEKLCLFFMGFLKKLHLMKRYDHYKRKLERTMDEFQECSSLISGKKSMVIQAYLLNLMQRVCNISVSSFMFLAGGGALNHYVNIWIAQTYVSVGANSVPIPGSMGVTDYLMLDAFGQFMGETEATQLELISRGCSFYVCIFVCSITTLIGYLHYRRKERNA